MTSSQ